MQSPIKVLIVEDVPTDAELVERELKNVLGPVEFFRVETREEYLDALNSFQPNLIISDFALPRFDGLAALELAKECAPDVPFVMLTGSINEDTAVDCMKAGAWDYVIKEHVKRLGSAVRGALHLRQVRFDQHRTEVALRQSEQRLKVAQRLGRVGHWEFDVQTRQLQWSDAVFAIYGRDPKLGPPSAEEEARYYGPGVALELRRCAQKTIETGEQFELELSLELPDGRRVDVTTIGSALTDLEGRVVRVLGTVQDVTARKRDDAQIRHLSSVLRAIRGVNRLIVRERDPRRLIQRACRMLVDDRGFKGAWIGLLGKNETATTWAQAGFGGGFESFARWLGEGRLPGCWSGHRSPDGAVAVLDPVVQCAACPLSREYGSDRAVVTNISHEGEELGVLVVSFPNHLTIDDEEQALLAEVAADLAFALCDIELEAQRDRYAQIVANSQEAMALIGPDLVYLEANTAYGRMVGQLTSAVVGQPVAAIVGEPLYANRVRPSLEKCLAGHVVQFESAQTSSVGSTRYWDTVLSPCFAANASVFAATLCIRDITRQKHAELALQIERDNLSAFLAAAPAAILVLDSEQRVLHANRAVMQLVDKPGADLFGLRCGDVLGCAHRQNGPRGCGSGLNCITCPLSLLLHETATRRQSVYGREVALAIDSLSAADQRWFVANTAPLSIEGGPGVVLAMHEVTDRRRTEETLRFQAMLLASQNEASIDGVRIEDDRGKLLWSNRRFAELWSLPLDALQTGAAGVRGQLIIAQLAAPEEYVAQLATVQSNIGAKSRNEVRLKDGRTFDCFSAPIIDPASTHLGRVWLFRDVTAEKRLQASVAQSDRLASMGMLAAGVAHEINNPLTYVLYNLESLTDDMDRYAARLALVLGTLAAELGDSRLRGLFGPSLELFERSNIEDMQLRFKEALVGTRKIKDIAKGLGSFSRVEKDEVAPVTLRGAIESAIGIAFNEIKYRARIVKDLKSTAYVMASDGRLSQVFLNLLINAAHSIPDGDVDGNQISIRTREEVGEVIAIVEDTGCGIPQENLERIFDPFFTTKPIGVGSGLGLNIVRSIIAGYGGAIEVMSTVGEGTRFVIRLPMASASVPESAEASEADRKRAGLRGRVMVIDDECAIRTVLTRILSWHEVVGVESGDLARGLLEKDQEFDVILCDMMMPRVSGMDVHRWLVGHYPSLARRVVFVTGGAFSPGARAYLEQVENLSIEKPIDATNLQKLVAERIMVARTQIPLQKV